MTQLLQVLILFEKATFTQIKYFHGNTTHDFTHTDYTLVTKYDNLAAGSSYPVKLFCDISWGISLRKRSHTKHS